MNFKEIIKFDSISINGEEVNSVDARTLHEALGSKQQFADWINAKVLNSSFFIENEDYILLRNSMKQKSNIGRGGSNRKDYALSLDTAKKVAMAEQTARGEEVREYFLECEKKSQGRKSSKLSEIAQDAKAVLDLELYVQDYLKTSEASKLEIIHSVYEDFNLSTKRLPVYTRNTKPTFSAKDLLNRFDCGISSIAFNKLMIANGLMEEKERSGRHGQIKKFKTLTESGLRYGQNDTSKHNPRETQPHYFEESFMELFNLLTQEESIAA